MLIIGLVGGVGCGKSHVASQFATLGAEVINADQLGHDLLLQEEVQTELRAYFGTGIFTSDGTVLRKELARLVFEEAEPGPSYRLFLEELLHPKIAQKVRERLDDARKRQISVVVLDAPLLLESNWADIVDLILFVDAPESIRLERVQARGWNQQEFQRRESAQWSLDRKRIAANAVIDNSGTIEQLNQTIRQIWKNLPK